MNCTTQHNGKQSITVTKEPGDVSQNRRIMMVLQLYLLWNLGLLSAFCVIHIVNVSLCQEWVVRRGCMRVMWKDDEKWFNPRTESNGWCRGDISPTWKLNPPRWSCVAGNESSVTDKRRLTHFSHFLKYYLQLFDSVISWDLTEILPSVFVGKSHILMLGELLMWLGWGKYRVFGLKYLFWFHKHGWRCPKVSSKISCLVTANAAEICANISLKNIHWFLT